MLSLCKSLFDDFNNQKIRYCHWKSNEHLSEGLDGKTDLDVLFDKADYFRIIDILNKYKFKKFNTISYLKYSAIDDYIGYDEETGRMIHLHLHFQLVLGKKFIKEYQLPFEEYIFRNVKLDVNNDIFVIDENIEMILLIVRFIMKHPNKIYFFGSNNLFNNEYLIEFNWLLSRIDLDEIKRHSINLFDETLASLIINFLKNQYDIYKFRELRRGVKVRIRMYTSENKFFSFFKYYLYKGMAIYNCIRAKKLKMPYPYRRTIPEGGKIIVFLGVDGAGKSTLMKETVKWLKWKLDLYNVYFGSGDGKSSLLRYPLLLITKIAKRNKKNDNIKFENNSENEIVKESTKKNILYKIFKLIWAISLAIEKRSKLRKVWRAKSKGLYVICDRYPQINTMGYNDGPLLSELSKSKNYLARKLSKWEYSIYSQCMQIAPDILIKLVISEEVSVKRKNDTPLNMIRKKITAVSNIEYADNTKVYTVNTEGSIEDSMKIIKKIIWE